MPELVRIARRCHVPPAQAAELVGRCSAVLETCADNSVISLVTAARLHGLWLPNGVDLRIHVATARPGVAGRAMTRTQRPEFVAHRFQLRPEDIVLVDGVPTTSPARTWRDLAMLFDLPDLVAAGDSALRSGVTEEELRDVLAASSRRHGAALAAAAIPMLDQRSESRPESHLRVAITAPDLPRFDANVTIYRAEGGWLARPDLSLEAAKLALEYQGEDHSGKDRMRKDITRTKDLRDEGWLMVPYGPAEVFGRPWTIKPDVRRLIAERAPHLLRPTRPNRPNRPSRPSRPNPPTVVSWRDSGQ